VSLHLTPWPAAGPAWPAAGSDRQAVDELAVILDATRGGVDDVTLAIQH
jgi:hypothetical protein